MYSLKEHIKWLLPIILLTILLMGMPSCKYLKQRLGIGEYSLKSAIKWAKQDSIRVADSLKRVAADKKKFERTLTDSLMSIADPGMHTGKSDPLYYIIIGSFTNHDNAILAEKQYSGEGFHPEIIATKRNGVKVELVSVKTFPYHAQATVFLKEFQSRNHPGAWIFSGD